MKKTIILILLLTLLLFSACNLSGALHPTIIAIWIYDIDGVYAMEDMSLGLFNVIIRSTYGFDNSSERKGTYKIEDDNIIIKWDDSDTEEEWTYSLDGDSLTLELDSGYIEEFRRSSSFWI